MTKTDRRQLLDRIAARIDPAMRKQHIEEQLEALKNQASRVRISVEQLEGDPHAQEVEKSQLDQGYQQLESLAWRIEDLTVRLEQMDEAHVVSPDGLNRAQRRAGQRTDLIRQRSVARAPQAQDQDGESEGEAP